MILLYDCNTGIFPASNSGPLTSCIFKVHYTSKNNIIVHLYVFRSAALDSGGGGVKKRNF